MAKKVVVFVDGENLVLRYEEMVEKGWVPKTYTTASTRGPITVHVVTHVPKSFVWSPSIFDTSGLDLVRINYYTSVVGTDERVAEVTNAIADTPFSKSEYGGQSSILHLIPRVHKKPKQSHKTKVVDVDITMDIMRAALTMPIDIIMLFSGDGDYAPLIREVARSTSKQVFLSAFSLGVSPALRTCAEHFSTLDADFFEHKPGTFDIRIIPDTTDEDPETPPT